MQHNSLTERKFIDFEKEKDRFVIMKFYGRETERKKLYSMFHTEGQMIALIYGRRRIGKSELIKQVLKET